MLDPALEIVHILDDQSSLTYSPAFVSVCDVVATAVHAF